jgi:hypothetical protein
MRQKPKGRTSIAALITPGVVRETRPPPPYNLTDAESRIWEMIVASMPADHFSPGNHAVLAQLCRHIASSDRFAMLIEQYAKQKKFNPEAFTALSRQQIAESTIINRLSRSMRLTQQALYRGESAKLRPVITSHPPWERCD